MEVQLVSSLIVFTFSSGAEGGVGGLRFVYGEAPFVTKG